MSLFTLRCYLKQKYNYTSLKNVATGIMFKMEVWEICLVHMLDFGESKSTCARNDKFHFNWEIMMLSLCGETRMTLKEFYNCKCNGSKTDSWETMVFVFNLKVYQNTKIYKASRNKYTFA